MPFLKAQSFSYITRNLFALKPKLLIPKPAAAEVEKHPLIQSVSRSKIPAVP
jgi:hypothetical protein